MSGIPILPALAREGAPLPRRAGESTFVSRLAEAAQPGVILSPASLRVLAAGETAVAVALWSQSSLEVLPRPAEVATALRTLWLEQGLGRELMTSLLLNVEAVVLTAVLGLGLAYLSVVPAVRPLAAAVACGRFLGLLGLTFVFTLLFGGGHALKVALLVFGMTVFLVTTMTDVVQSIPSERFDHARTLRMGEWRVVWEVVVRGTADQAWDAVRQNAAIGWMMLTMVEGIARAEGGVGALLLAEHKHFRLPEVFAIQLLVLAVGLGQDALFGYGRRLFFPWSQATQERAS